MRHLLMVLPQGMTLKMTSPRKAIEADSILTAPQGQITHLQKQITRQLLTITHIQITPHTVTSAMMIHTLTLTLQTMKSPHLAIPHTLHTPHKLNQIHLKSPQCPIRP